MHGRFRRSLSQPSAPPMIKVYDYKIDELVQLQDTIGRYRGEMSGIKVKSRLENLMGSDVVQLNDRAYMLKLQEQLSREYEVQMDRWENVRVDREKRRQRRLYIDGLQDTPNIDGKNARAPLSAGGQRNANTAAEQQVSPPSGLHIPQGICDSPPGRGTTSHHQWPHKDKQRSLSATEKRSQPKQNLLLRSGSPNPTALSLISGSSALKRSSEKPRSDVIQGVKKPLDTKLPNLSGPGETKDYVKGPAELEQPSTHSPRSSLLKQLRQEETVKGLYKTADTLLQRSAPPYQVIVTPTD